MTAKPKDPEKIRPVRKSGIKTMCHHDHGYIEDLKKRLNCGMTEMEVRELEAVFNSLHVLIERKCARKFTLVNTATTYSDIDRIYWNSKEGGP